MALDPDLATWLAGLAEAGLEPMHAAGPDRARRAYRRMTQERWPGLATVSAEDITVPARDGRSLAVRVYRPFGTPRATCVFAHGGGWVIGDLDSHDNLARALSGALHAVVVSLDYRRAPEHPFPAAFDDTVDGIRWAHEHAASLGGATLLLAGDSAGANLVLAAGRSLADDVDVAAQLLLCPLLDLEPRTPSRDRLAAGFLLEAETLAWFSRCYAGTQPLADLTDDPRTAPAAAPSLTGTAPSLLVVAEFDPLRDEGLEFLARARSDDVTVGLVDLPGMVHGFPDLVAHSPAAARAVRLVLSAFAAFAFDESAPTVA